MAAFTPIKADDGYYVSLFPATYLNCTQTWGAGTLSHRNHQSDWAFPSNEYPYYACAPMTCYQLTSSGYIWSTDEQVHTPSGLSYVSIWVAHDNDASRAVVGTKVGAGEILGHSGVRGFATGDHLHLDCSLAHNGGIASNGEALADDRNPAEVFYIDDSYTVVNTTANGITISFQKWDGGTPTPPTPVEPTYTLNVINGTPTTSSGKEGTKVNITADKPGAGQHFSQWALTGGVGTIEDASKEKTVFTIGKGNGTVTAEFIKTIVKDDSIVLFYIPPFIKNNQIV